MLHADPRQAGLVAGEKARQLIGGHEEIDGGDNEQHDAEQSRE